MFHFLTSYRIVVNTAFSFRKEHHEHGGAFRTLPTLSVYPHSRLNAH